MSKHMFTYYLIHYKYFYKKIKSAINRLKKSFVDYYI
ncbi:protein of unknown function [Paenibacillus alvei]|uniref:Uncharacterized protein n=1 Tax=Paenibacillus alvei TaxID=44250 RepID=A0A383RCK2_PAEAL|nr:protein of unknown function [Paenibacillus alvei]